MQEAKAAGAESSNQLKARLSKGLFELNLKLASCKSGALVQVSHSLVLDVSCSVIQQLSRLKRAVDLDRYGCQKLQQTVAWCSARR